MKGRILIGAAAIATSVAASIAQDVPKLYILDVKGPNLVGYYNVTVPAHAFYLIANQLNAPTNMLSALIPSPPPGSQFYKYNEVTGCSAATYDDLAGAWDGDFSLNPGEGGMFKNGGGSPFTITFVGEVLQGSLINTLPSGYSIRSSMVPQAGRITADLGLPAQAGDQAFIIKSHGTYAAYTYDDIAGDWDTPGGPVVQVGQSFFYRNASAPRLWIRNFTVN